MIVFEKEVKKVLPYDRQQYIKYLGDYYRSSEWNGVSFHLNKGERNLGFANYFIYYEPLFRGLLLNFNKSDRWIVNHDYHGQDWFPNDENTLGTLRALFKQNKIPNTFKGALIFERDDLLEFSRDLLSYPYTMFNAEGLLYSDLDISHAELQFILKISGHWTIDLLSTDKELLRKVIKKNTSTYFNVKEFRGTSL